MWLEIHKNGCRSEQSTDWPEKLKTAEDHIYLDEVLALIKRVDRTSYMDKPDPKETLKTVYP